MNGFAPGKREVQWCSYGLTLGRLEREENQRAELRKNTKGQRAGSRIGNAALR